ncbi:MAG: hypothetical protein B7X76_01190 [Azorhizobium sp. 39-67-5]|nr:MAG: hypothetical protein B7X76_01190 [Azorhizobium sp. 39-67-5]
MFLSGWVWFRALTLDDAGALFAGLSGMNGFGPIDTSLQTALQPVTLAMLVLGWPLAIWGVPMLKGGPVPPVLRRAIYGMVDSVVMLVLFALCIMNVGAANYSPFLYFRF